MKEEKKSSPKKQDSNKVVIDLPQTVTGETFEYEVPENEKEHTAHIYQEKVRFATGSPLRLSKGYVQKYDRQGWDNFRAYGTSQGWTIVPLHLPSGWSDEVGTLSSVGKKSNQRPK